MKFVPIVKKAAKYNIADFFKRVRPVELLTITPGQLYYSHIIVFLP